MEQRAHRIIGNVFSIVGIVFLVIALLVGGLGVLLDENVFFFIVLIPFVVVGGAFFLIGQLVFLARVRKKQRMRDELLTMGYCVMAKIVDVEKNRMVHVNGRSPYRVRCRYEAPDGTVHEFCSWDINYDPTGLFLRDTVDVYVDRYDMNRYYVDLERVLQPFVRH